MHDQFPSFDNVPRHTWQYYTRQLTIKTTKQLYHYGFGGTILDWLNKFLIGRTMKMVLDGKMSREMPVDYGLSQGTVPGPLLFPLCHINDFRTTVKSQVRLFAEGCLLYHTIHIFNDYIVLQHDLIQLGGRIAMQVNISYLASHKSKLKP